MSKSKSEIFNPDYIEAKVRRNVVRIPFEDITHFQSEHKYVVAYHAHGQFILGASLSDLEKVYGDRLIRVHRSALVVRHRLAAVRTYATGVGGNRQWRVTVQGSPEKVDASRQHIPFARAEIRSRQGAVQ